MNAPSKFYAKLKKLGRYRIVRPLSKGGMALVYEGVHEGLEGVSTRVAIKLILPEHAKSETFRQLFINEAKLGAAMQHQNLVQIRDFDCDQDRFFLVMEYVEGMTFSRLMNICRKKGVRFPLNVVLELGRQACTGVHYAHQAKDDQDRHLGLVHRDLKPSNLIVTPQGVVKVLDFGISKGILREEREGSVKGTWGYMSPEQARGAEVCPSTDVFGLATVLYELAAGRPMYPTKDRKEIRKLLFDGHPARMAATLDTSYEPLVSILVRALHPNQGARFQSAADFGRSLAELIVEPVRATDDVCELIQRVSMPDTGGQASDPGLSEVESSASEIEDQRSELYEPSQSNRNGLSLGWFVGLVGLGALGLIMFANSGMDQHALAHPSLPVNQDGRMIYDEPGGSSAEPVTHTARRTTAEMRGPQSGFRGPPRTHRVTEGEGDRTEEPIISDGKPELEEKAGPAKALGFLMVDANIRSEVYVGGQFVGYTPIKDSFVPGSYAVSIVSPDGKRKSFLAKVEKDGRVRRHWNFNRLSWR